jgi:hypothetical protein
MSTRSSCFVIAARRVMLTAVARPGAHRGIAAAVVLLYGFGPWPWLESAGRLAVFSTVFCSHGFGRVGAATGVGLSVALFTVQLTVSRWWSDRIGAGPVERVLRWVTYGLRP